MVEDGKVAATSPLSKPNLLHLMKNCAEMMCLPGREGLPALNLRCYFFFLTPPPDRNLNKNIDQMHAARQI